MTSLDSQIGLLNPTQNEGHPWKTSCSIGCVSLMPIKIFFIDWWEYNARMLPNLHLSVDFEYANPSPLFLCFTMRARLKNIQGREEILCSRWFICSNGIKPSSIKIVPRLAKERNPLSTAKQSTYGYVELLKGLERFESWKGGPQKFKIYIF